MNAKQPQDAQRADPGRSGAHVVNLLPTNLGNIERSKLAHELRTSFAVILMRVDALLYHDINVVPETSRNTYLEEIRIAANHALEIIEATTHDPDDFADNDTPPTTDLQDNVRQTLVLVTPLAQDASVKLTIDALEEKIPVRVRPAALRQILLNILVNAIKFTPADGNVNIGFLIADQTCTISVRDNGIGIAPSELARIKGHGCGRGYGYDITKSLLKAYGAELSVESQRNFGTTVSVTFSINHT